MERNELRYMVELALDIMAIDPAMREAEVCASWCEQQVVGIQHDSERPDEAAPLLQSTQVCGLSVLFVLTDGTGHRVGFGSDTDELSRDSILTALESAKSNAVPDPRYISLPQPVSPLSPAPVLYDPEVFTLADDAMMTLAGEALEGVLLTFKAAGYVTRLRVGGEVRSRKEHLVVANTHGLLAEETSTALLASLYAHLTYEQSRGHGSHSATHVYGFSPADAGVAAAQHALRARGGITLTGGNYPVVFGPQAVADLLQDLVLPMLSLDTITAGTNPFATRLGQQIASPLLTVADEGRLPGLLGSHAITGEGLPTGTTSLIDQGRLVGFLADTYHAQALASGLGLMTPRNGMRYATDGRGFATRPGIFPTNVTFASPDAMSLEALLAPIDAGIYVGGLWYTTPQGGLHTGDFTGTVIGPSFHIRHGKLAAPLQPGTLRLQDNVAELLQRLTGLSTTRHPIVLATRQSVVLAPELRCSHAHFVT
jgi:predicted Zn-dependent protease